jgi:hypothetical protein
MYQTKAKESAFGDRQNRALHERIQIGIYAKQNSSTLLLRIPQQIFQASHRQVLLRNQKNGLRDRRPKKSASTKFTT